MIVRDGAEEVTPCVYLASVLRAEISLLSSLPGGEETTVPPAWPSAQPPPSLAGSSAPTAPGDEPQGFL